MGAYLPPGWPPGVHPPGTADFETSAVAWLLDVVPPDYRLHGVLRRHPVALATMARHHVAACVQGARQGYRAVRTELGGMLPASGVDAVLDAYRTEGRRLVEAAQAVDLVDRALRGKEFTPQLRTERARRPAEQARNRAEQARQPAEQARKTAEQARNPAEQARKPAKGARRTAEGSHRPAG
jgi:hypothetical protein